MTFANTLLRKPVKVNWTGTSRRSREKLPIRLPVICALRNIGFKSRDLMKAAGADVELIERCSAVDGTWGFKKEYYQLSMKVAEPLFEKVDSANPDYAVSDCPLSGLQIEQGTRRKVLHPIQIVHIAYGLDEKRDEED